MTLPELILASASPRRRELLSLLGLPFRVVPPPQEDLAPSAGAGFEAAAEALARDKARAVASGRRRGIVVAADTIVVHRGRALGKPQGPEEARHMLLALRGRGHRVITGLAALDIASGREAINHTLTRVWMRLYSPAEVDAYIASGDPMDKAGAYAIQNTLFRPVARAEGCYFNVVGLPLYALVEALGRVGFPVPPQARGNIPPACQGCPTGVASPQAATPGP